MNVIKGLSLCLTLTGAVAVAESVRVAPGIDIYQSAAAFRDIFNPTNGQSALCLPAALAQRFIHQKFFERPGYAQLQIPMEPDHPSLPDKVALVKSLAEKCHTSVAFGTYPTDAVSCIRAFYLRSGYDAWAYVIGPSARTWPSNAGAGEFFKFVDIDDVRSYVSHGYGALVDVGWYVINPKTKSWVRNGGHFVNVYGYEYDAADGDDHVSLRVENPAVDYSRRPTGSDFDTVTMQKISEDALTNSARYELTGPGFSMPGRHALVESLIVFLPF